MGTLTDEEMEEYKKLKKSREKQYKRQKKYLKSRERSYVTFPKGTKDRISSLTDESINAFINRLVLAELDRIENKSTPEPVDMSKYQDFPTLAPIPQTMGAEDEALLLQELQKKIDARKGNASRINEDASESILGDADKENIANGKEPLKMDDTGAEEGMESIGDILDDFMNPPETDWLSQKEQEINDRIDQKNADAEKFQCLTMDKIESMIQDYGKRLIGDESLKDQIIEAHGQTNYDTIIAEMKHRRMIRTEDDFKIKGDSVI